MSSKKKDLRVKLEKMKEDLKNLNKERKDIIALDYEEHAGMLMDKLFEKFPDGSAWLGRTKDFGKKHTKVVGPMGRVRHLSQYLHHDRGVQAAAARRGPNSAIQGAASDIGSKAGRTIQKLVWKLFREKGVNFSLRQVNSVHDSLKSITHILDLPLAAYIKEHAMVSQAHKHAREIFGFKNYVDYEVEAEIGPHQAALTKWDYTYFSKDESNALMAKPGDGGLGMVPIVEAHIDWQNENLKANLNKQVIMEHFIHNCKIIDKIRRKEIEQAMQSDTPSEIMLLTEELVPKLGYRFGCDYDGQIYNKPPKKLKKAA